MSKILTNNGEYMYLEKKLKSHFKQTYLDYIDLDFRIKGFCYSLRKAQEISD